MLLFGNDRGRIRRYFVEVWRKHLAGQPLEPLERVIVGVVGAHPEYQAVLTGTEESLARDYLPELGETNPFLHMGMHIAIQEQLLSDRPPGIIPIYEQLCQRYGDSHTAEHQMMECLGETLWEAQRSGAEPDATAYLQRLKRLLRSNGGNPFQETCLGAPASPPANHLTIGYLTLPLTTNTSGPRKLRVFT